MKACFRIFCQIYPALGANPLSYFLIGVFFENQAKIGVLRALEWLSGMSGAKIMETKTKIGENLG